MSAWGHSQRFRSHSLLLIFISWLSCSGISTSGFWFSFVGCNLRPSDSFAGWRLSSWLFVRSTLHKMCACVSLTFGFNSSKVVMRIAEMVMLLWGFVVPVFALICFAGEKSFITAGTPKMLEGWECEARPSGWHGKRSKSREASSWFDVSVSLTAPPHPVMSFLWLRCMCVSWPRLLPHAGPRCWCHIPACKGYAETITHHLVRHTPVLQETSISFFHDPPSVSH